MAVVHCLAELALVASWMTNPSDFCSALVTEAVQIQSPEYRAPSFS